MKCETATVEGGSLVNADARASDAGELLRLGQERDRADRTLRRRNVVRLARRLEFTVFCSSLALYVGAIAVGALYNELLDGTFGLGAYRQRVPMLSAIAAPLWVLCLVPWFAIWRASLSKCVNLARAQAALGEDPDDEEVRYRLSSLKNRGFLSLPW